MAMIATDMVIKQLCKETGEPGFHNYTTIEGLMLDAIADLNIFTMPCWSVATIDITSFHTIDWPCDCIKPLVAALKRDNKHYLLSVSTDLLGILDPISTASEPESCEAGDLFRIDGFIETFGWSVWSWGLGELYGAETMLPPFGLITHDKQRNQSFIKGCRINTGDQVVMFFKSNGLTECPTFIPSEAKEQIEYFILQKYFRTRNPNLAAINRSNYKEENYRLSRFYDEGDEDTWIRAMNSNQISSPKI